MYFLIAAGIVLFILLGIALAWRTKKATHYRGPGVDSVHQPLAGEEEHMHAHHHHDHHHHHDSATPTQHIVQQEQSTHHTSSSVPPTPHVHP